MSMEILPCLSCGYFQKPQRIGWRLIAEILSNADLIQIQEGQGDLKRASAYLKRLAEKTEYHDYTIDELTQYLPKEKKLYSVSDIYNAYNRWYGRGLKTHIYKAYKEKRPGQN